MKNLLAIPSSYPTERAPNQGVFVQSLLERFRRMGTRVSVIAPQRYLSGPSAAAHEDDRSPRYLSFSSRMIGPFSTFPLTVRSFARAVRSALPALKEKPEAVYSHFLIPGGFAAAETGRLLSVPSFVALGEGSFSAYTRHLPHAFLKDLLNRFSGILCLSEENRMRCQEEYGVPKDRLAVFPNAADTDRFFPRNRESVRRELGLPLEAFLAIFVGHFNENKGVHRVIEAVKRAPGTRVILLGDGASLPEEPQILKAARVKPELVSAYLAAADVFILPSQQDCSPNVVMEAMACGLPVIGSDIPSIRAMTGTEAGIHAGALDIPAFASALTRLRENHDLRRVMGEEALKRARSWDLSARALAILDWMDHQSAGFKGR